MNENLVAQSASGARKMLSWRQKYQTKRLLRVGLYTVTVIGAMLLKVGFLPAVLAGFIVGPFFLVFFIWPDVKSEKEVSAATLRRYRQVEISILVVLAICFVAAFILDGSCARLGFCRTS